MASSTNSVFLWDTEINPVVVSRNFFPYDTASVTVGRLYPQIPIDKWGGTGYLLRTNGSVVRATAVTLALGRIGNQAGCADSHYQAGKIVVTLDHRLAAGKERFGVVSYQSATGAVATEPDGTTIVFPKAHGTLITTFGPGPLDRVAWSLHSGESVCVTGFKVVVPEPAAAR